jgi:prophage regulatory protein
MININNNLRIDRRSDLLFTLNISRSNFYQKIAQGLWTKPVSLGARAVGWPSNESEQLLSAMISGQSPEEIKELVKILEENRKQFKAVL